MIISFFDDEPEIFPLQYGGKARTIINLAKELVKYDKIERVNIYSNSIKTRKEKFTWEGIYFIKVEEYNVYEYIHKECENSDIISIHFCSFSFPNIENCKAKLIYNLHDIMVSTQDRGSHLDKALSGGWDAIIAPSEFVKDTFLAFSGPFSQNNKIVVVPRGIDFSTIYYVESHTSMRKISEMLGKAIDFEGKVVFVPGRKGCGKGEQYFSFLLDALNARKEKFVIFTTLDVQQSDNVFVVDWIPSEHIKYFYSIADITVNFSILPEAFSNICLESLACRTLVACFGFGNLRNITCEFSSVFLMQPISKSIEQVLNKAFEIGNENIGKDYEKLLYKYNLSIISKKYIEVYEELLNGNNGLMTNLYKGKYILSPYAYLYERHVWLNDKNLIREYDLTEAEFNFLKNIRDRRSQEKSVLTTERLEQMINQKLIICVK